MLASRHELSPTSQQPRLSDGADGTGSGGCSVESILLEKENPHQAMLLRTHPPLPAVRHWRHTPSCDAAIRPSWEGTDRQADRQVQAE